MNIGENIKKFRKLKGLTQGELSEKIGKSLRQTQKYEADEVTPSLCKQSVLNYETGKREPPISSLEMIAKALDTTINQLLDIPETIVIKEPMQLSDVSTDDLMSELARRLK